MSGYFSGFRGFGWYSQHTCKPNKQRHRDWNCALLKWKLNLRKLNSMSSHTFCRFAQFCVYMDFNSSKLSICLCVCLSRYTQRERALWVFLFCLATFKIIKGYEIAKNVIYLLEAGVNFSIFLLIQPPQRILQYWEFSLNLKCMEQVEFLAVIKELYAMMKTLSHHHTGRVCPGLEREKNQLHCLLIQFLCCPLILPSLLWYSICDLLMCLVRLNNHSIIYA